MLTYTATIPDNSYIIGISKGDDTESILSKFYNQPNWYLNTISPNKKEGSIYLSYGRFAKELCQLHYHAMAKYSNFIDFYLRLDKPIVLTEIWNMPDDGYILLAVLDSFYKQGISLPPIYVHSTYIPISLYGKLYKISVHIDPKDATIKTMEEYTPDKRILCLSAISNSPNITPVPSDMLKLPDNKDYDILHIDAKDLSDSVLYHILCYYSKLKIIIYNRPPTKKIAGIQTYIIDIKVPSTEKNYMNLCYASLQPSRYMTISDELRRKTERYVTRAGDIVKTVNVNSMLSYASDLTKPEKDLYDKWIVSGRHVYPLLLYIVTCRYADKCYINKIDTHNIFSRPDITGPVSHMMTALIDYTDANIAEYAQSMCILPHKLNMALKDLKYLMNIFNVTEVTFSLSRLMTIMIGLNKYPILDASSDNKFKPTNSPMARSSYMLSDKCPYIIPRQLLLIKSKRISDLTAEGTEITLHIPILE